MQPKHTASSPIFHLMVITTTTSRCLPRFTLRLFSRVQVHSVLSVVNWAAADAMQSIDCSLSLFLLAPLIIANWINDCSCLCEEIWMDGVSFFNSTLVQVLWFAFSRSVLTLQLVLSAIQAQCNVGCIFEDALVMFFLVLFFLSCV